MRKLLFCCMILSMIPAFAGTITYTLTSGSDTIIFSLPSTTPTPLSCTTGYGTNADCFTVNIPSGSFSVDGSSTSNGIVNFYVTSVGGGFTILSGSTLLVNNSGSQLFSGSLASPTLLTFSNLQLTQAGYGPPRYNEAFILNASTGVPEPSTAMLFLVAGSLLAGVRLRRRSS